MNRPHLILGAALVVLVSITKWRVYLQALEHPYWTRGRLVRISGPMAWRHPSIALSKPRLGASAQLDAE